MENQIHMLEQEAYASILRAFKAQADVITWVYINVQFENLEVLIFFFNFINSRNNKWFQEKESLMTGIRKELRVTDDEHRTLLGRVNADDLIHRIR